MKSTSIFRSRIIREYNRRIKALVSSQNVQSQFLNGSEFPRCSNAGKVIFEWCKQVADYRDAPWSAQEPLPRQSAHVGHVRIVDREAKDPEGGKQSDRRGRGAGGRHGKIIMGFCRHSENQRERRRSRFHTSPSQCTRVCLPSRSWRQGSAGPCPAWWN